MQSNLNIWSWKISSITNSGSGTHSTTCDPAFLAQVTFQRKTFFFFAAISRILAPLISSIVHARSLTERDRTRTTNTTSLICFNECKMTQQATRGKISMIFLDHYESHNIFKSSTKPSWSINSTRMQPFPNGLTIVWTNFALSTNRPFTKGFQRWGLASLLSRDL